MKVLLPDLQADSELADRFLREIKVQAAMDHPNITKLHTAFQFEGRLIMVMEYVEGTPLEGLLHDGPLPVGDALRDCIQVLDALGYAHERGVVHRDLKPSNMMLTRDGTVKLMDFGIARLSQDRKLTQTGRTLGSLFYMSPEQIRGDPNIDGRSDIYSLGICLYELVTGKRPFVGDSEYSIMAAHLQQAAVPPVEVDPSIPKPLSDVILLAINKDPEQRFQKAAAMKNALAEVARILGADAGVAAAAPTPVAAPPLSSGPVQAPAPPPPVQANFAAPAPAPAPRMAGSRIFYIAAGSLITIAVLVFAAIQVPRWMGTRAQTGEVQQVEQPQSTPPGSGQTPTSPQVPTGETALPGSQTAIPPPESLQLPAAGGAASEAQVPAALTRQAVPATRQSRPAVKNGDYSRPNTSRPAAPPSGNASSANASSANTSPASPPPAVAPPKETAAPQAAANAANAEELNQLQDRMMMLATRVGVVNRSLDRLQKQQAGMGLGLRGDMAASKQRMELFMDNAEAALKSQNANVARQNLDRAEREIEKLEKFFNM